MKKQSQQSEDSIIRITEDPGNIYPETNL